VHTHRDGLARPDSPFHQRHVFMTVDIRTIHNGVELPAVRTDDIPFRDPMDQRFRTQPMRHEASKTDHFELMLLCKSVNVFSLGQAAVFA
jgi:hypothetical protein